MKFKSFVFASLVFSSVAVADQDSHILFANPQAAIAWSNANAATLLPSAGTTTLTVLPLTDSRYATLQGYVHQMWGAFNELFPAETADLNEPPVVLVESPVINAFVTADATATHIPHLVVVLTGLANIAEKNPDAVYGVMAHELAHSVFRHALARYRTPINKFFLSNSTSTLDYLYPRNTDLDTKMNRWLELATTGGPLTYPELHDLPPGLATTPMPSSLLVAGQMRKDFYDANSPACQRADAAAANWSSLFQFSQATDAVTVKDLPALDADSQLVSDSLRACYAGKTKPFLNLVSEATGIPVEALSEDPEFTNAAKLFDAAPDAISGLQSWIRDSRQAMVSIQNSVEFSRVSYYTYEEHADDISALINAYIKRDPSSMSALFSLMLGQASANDLAQCQAIVSEGQTPALGPLSEPHHSLCYRMFHLNQMKKALPLNEQGLRTFANSLRPSNLL